MARSFLTAQNISFNYDNQEKNLFSDFSVTFPTGWSGIAGPNGTGKSTLLKILAGIISPLSGRIIRPGSVIYVDQVCNSVPEILFDLFSRSDSEALYLISILGLEYDWPYRWDTLSHGEKKRCQVGAAVAADPEALLLDEPVNHLDIKSGKQVEKAMAEYRGCGVVVSHSREILDSFCSQTVFLPEGQVYPGGYTKARKERERIQKELRREYESARQELERLKREARRRRELAAAQQSRRSKKHLDLKDSDGRAKLDLARFTGKDGTGGRLLRQMDGRISQTQDKLNSIHFPRGAKKGFSFHSGVQYSDFIWRRDGGKIHFNGESGDGLNHDELSISPGDRILITGNNGTGKSTLLKSVFSDISSSSWYLQQEMNPLQLDEQKIRFKGLNRKIRGRVLSSLSRMGADPSDFLTLHTWSPGEVKKLTLAMALEDIIPHKSLILLDEPLNHLDLETCEMLEEALETFPGAIVTISHETSFLKEFITAQWHLERCPPDSLLKTV